VPGAQDETVDGRFVMRLERTFACPPEQVWRALTQPDVLSTWYDQMIDYDASRLDFAEGANLMFVAKDTHLFAAQHGRVTRIDRPRLLEYTRASQELRWQLAAASEGASRLVLTVVVDTQASVIAGASLLRAALDRLDTTLTSTPGTGNGQAHRRG
jgi:uncharacterized protein YndB with AHSA1/START domain